MKLRNIFILIISFAFALLTSSMLAQEKTIEKKDLHEAVLTSFQKNYPNAEIKGTSTEKEHGKTYYEIESMDGSQRGDLLYAISGKVAEVEETLASNNIPEFVKSSVMKKYPNGEVTKYFKTKRLLSIPFQINLY
jgi:hypothetical protein